MGHGARLIGIAAAKVCPDRAARAATLEGECRRHQQCHETHPGPLYHDVRDITPGGAHRLRTKGRCRYSGLQRSRPDDQAADRFRSGSHRCVTRAMGGASGRQAPDFVTTGAVEARVDFPFGAATAPWGPGGPVLSFPRLSPADALRRPMRSGCLFIGPAPLQPGIAAAAFGAQPAEHQRVKRERHRREASDAHHDTADNRGALTPGLRPARCDWDKPWRQRCRPAEHCSPLGPGSVAARASTLALSGAGLEPRPSALFCPAGRNRLLVNVPSFRPIGSEERLSFGSGGKWLRSSPIRAARAARRRQRRAGPVPDDIEGLVGGPVSASYGAQASGPARRCPPSFHRQFVTGRLQAREVAAIAAWKPNSSRPAPAWCQGGEPCG